MNEQQQQQQINFDEILGEQPKQEENDAASLIMRHIEGFASAVGHKFNEVEAGQLALEGRVDLIEKYLAFLLTKNSDFAEWIKQQATEAKKGSLDGEPTGQQQG